MQHRQRYSPEEAEAVKEGLKKTFNIAPADFERMLQEDATLTESQKIQKIRFLRDYLHDDGER